MDHSRFDAEKIDRPTITYWQGAWRRLKKNPLAVVAMVMLAVVLFFVLLGPTISGQGVHQDQRVYQEYGSEQCQLVWHRHHGP